MNSYDARHNSAPHMPAFAWAITHLLTAITDWNDARATRRALSRLDDRELADIGLNRGDIEAVARR
ncbi:DUF1127 domain-containing protein [Pseudooceanicola sp. CBS1P-1]|uniref:DUF1127 domain-containing protein n=1 Tax=Pseudooceanicola albus TaxID=2692189 RepID=A0A6L7FZZ2_9RHOB|nr:DUF1127 domain-containing protein [Pseudooceanicola endophyticus]MXN17249.1 DUF1127 domain-containing protein [Pseudooceanicola albus]